MALANLARITSDFRFDDDDDDDNDNDDSISGPLRAVAMVRVASCPSPSSVPKTNGTKISSILTSVWLLP